MSIQIQRSHSLLSESIALFTFILLITASLVSSTMAYSDESQLENKRLDKERSAMMKYRKLFMETKGKHAKAIKLLIKNKLSLGHIVSHGEALERMADDMLLIFPKGSMGGKSRAMQNIWDEQGELSQDFKNKVEAMRTEASKLVIVAKRGNYKKIRKQMATFANKGCRNCHSDFRGE